MHVATHLIKIKGEFDENWDEAKLRKYVKAKIKNEVERYYHADLEKFQIHDNIIDVWIFIEATLEDSEIEDLANNWLKGHIIEDGITVKNLEIKKIPFGDFNVVLNDISVDMLDSTKDCV